MTAQLAKVPWTTLGVGLALLVLSWVAPAIEPTPGLDQSWSAALHMAAREGLHHGTDFVFTYGPLGFLKEPKLWFDDTAGAALAYRAVIRLLLCIALYVALRRAFGSIVAFAIVLVILPITAEAVVPLVFVVSLWMMLRRKPHPRTETAFAVGVGILTAFECLAKLNVGIACGAVATVALLFMPGRRAQTLAIFAGSAAVTGLILWAVAGQPLANLPEFASNAGRIVSGYSSAMVLEDPGAYWEFTAALLCVLGGAYATLVTTAQADSRARMGALLAWLTLSFISFKAGFVRQGAVNTTVFFGTLAAALAGLSWRRVQLPQALTLLAIPLLSFLAASNARIRDVVSPFDHVRIAHGELRTMLSSERRAGVQRAGREAVFAKRGLDPRTRRLVGDRTVHVLPTEASVVWAYHLNWAPLPVFQAYAVYTLRLDQLNADRIASDRAPEVILTHPEIPVDGRYPGFDAPATTRAMLCRYTEIRRTRAWQVLERGPNRCGQPRLVASVTSAWDKPVPVPAPTRDRNRFVFVRIAGAQVRGLERLRATLYKARERHVVLNGGSVFRLVPGTASDGLVLRAGRGVDYKAPYSVAPGAETIAVRVARGSQPDETLRYDFYEVTVGRA